MEPVPPVQQELRFTVWSQKLVLDVDFLKQIIKGRTEIVIFPHHKELKRIHLHCRQPRILNVTVDGKASTFSYEDPYERINPRATSSVYQHHLVRQKIEPQLLHPPEEELVIHIPKSVHIRELDPFSLPSQSNASSRTRDTASGNDNLAELALPNTSVEQVGNFQQLRVNIDFEVKSWREGVQFVGLQGGDKRYPYLYTRNSSQPGSASCLFPCVDRLSSQCSWDISITCPRTLGDAFNLKNGPSVDDSKKTDPTILADGISKLHVVSASVTDETFDIVDLSDEEKSIEMSVVCSGDFADEIIEASSHSRKTVSFSFSGQVAPQHIGFAVGPFKHVDLSVFREADEEEKLGQKAVQVHGFCLPGRESEVRNVCLPVAKAIDHFILAYGAFPFSNAYKMCFVDDLSTDVVHTAGLSICSNRLLFPEDILDPLDKVTRTIVHGIASQWLGVSIVPEQPSDAWVVIGLSYYITDLFLKKLLGNNEYRYQQKLAADKIFELDRNRPSMYTLGSILNLDPSELEFLALKSSVVLFILDRRLTKANGSSSVSRVVTRLFSIAKAGEEAEKRLSTSNFQRTCEKIGHARLDTFFQQWVYGAGCPHFFVRQQFNKKKLVVEMIIEQKQQKYESSDQDIDPNSFIRDVREDVNDVYAGSFQPIFTGPMTIRIHEADGTPYEHIVEIKDAKTRFDIPYNTKYKRLKRNRRQKDRSVTAAGVETSADAQDDILLYCLGDVLQTQEEVAEWRLSDWQPEVEEKMSQESYEWIRMDADFEWICKMSINMPAYMFLSQLQQDRDVVAQLESVQYLLTQNPNPLNSTFLIRTLVDKRYFHGIRTLAATGLARGAKEEFDWLGLFHLEKIFQELYCFPDSPMTRSNDFSDRTSYIIQCAIPKALARIKTHAGEAPRAVKRFFIDKLKFNENSSNDFSDVHYVATLLHGLAETMTKPSRITHKNELFDEDEDEPDIEDEEFNKAAIAEIERYRRIDEWTPSYQNIYSVTALDCLLKLAKNNVYRPKLVNFVQYTRLGMADTVRLKALDSIVQLGAWRTPALLKLFFFTLSTDTSPYVREHVFQIVAKGLGQIAVGSKQDDYGRQSASVGMIIEQDGSTEERQSDFIRKRTIPGALTALKAELGDDETLKKALWSAVCSPAISITELSDLISLCSLLYEPKSSLIVNLRYPRYWCVKHVGYGVLHFSKTNKIRTAPLPQPLAPAESAVIIQPEVSNLIDTAQKISAPIQNSDASVTVVPRPKTITVSGKGPTAASLSVPKRTPTVLKLNAKSASQIRALQPPSVIAPGPVYINGKTNAGSPQDGTHMLYIPGVSSPAMSPPPRPSSASSNGKRRNSSTSQTVEQPPKRPMLKLRFSSGASSPPLPPPASP